MIAAAVLALLLGVDPQTAAEPDPAAPVETPESLTRIATALARPPRLRLDAPLPEPTFRIEIQQHPYFTDIPFTWTFGGGGVPFTGTGAAAAASQGTTPLVQVDALPILAAVRRAWTDRESRSIRENVQRELAEFCATHGCDRQ